LPVGRVSSTISVAAIVVLIATALGGVATASVSRKSPDQLAKQYGLLRESDLPAGYSLQSARRESGRTAQFVEVVGDCSRVNPGVHFLTGNAPETVIGTYEEAPSGGYIGGNAAEAIYAFDDDGDAKAYVEKFDAGFDELADCGLMADPIGTIGTYAPLDVGKVGSRRSGISFDPRGSDPYTRFSVTRSGKVVVYVELHDEHATDAEFRALVKTANKRAA
jgi:hypothetical protein